MIGPQPWGPLEMAQGPIPFTIYYDHIVGPPEIVQKAGPSDCGTTSTLNAYIEQDDQEPFAWIILCPQSFDMFPRSLGMISCAELPTFATTTIAGLGGYVFYAHESGTNPQFLALMVVPAEACCY